VLLNIPVTSREEGELDVDVTVERRDGLTMASAHGGGEGMLVENCPSSRLALESNGMP
jgi:hypothetical protein